MTPAEQREEGAIEAVLQRFDSVYFLMWPGWKSELRSNRWHYATRWARHLPVTLVQPDLAALQRDGEPEPEPRIPNCRVLHVRPSAYEPSYAADSFLQTVQLMRDQQREGYQRALLWLYNPCMVGAYATLPNAGRVQHATENYFGFPAVTRFLRESMKLSLRISDHVVGVSEGVVSAMRRYAPKARVSLVSNGCDFAAYSAGRPDPDVAALRQRWKQVAVFAGNINARLDFPLIHAACRAAPETAFLLVGPTGLLTGEKAAAWRQVLSLPNAIHRGAVEPDRLPHIYAAADLGLIPYEDSALMRDSFPLKALEMAATGLPVVTSELPELRGLAEALQVTGRQAEFVAAIESMSRRRMTAGQAAELRELAKAHDYDVKFAEMLRSIEPSVRSADGRRERDQVVAHAYGPLWEKLLLWRPPSDDPVQRLLRKWRVEHPRFLLARVVQHPRLAPVRRFVRASGLHGLLRRIF
jgi:glycosyltransferase involved in cell wall biosynthesis